MTRHQRLQQLADDARREVNAVLRKMERTQDLASKALLSELMAAGRDARQAKFDHEHHCFSCSQDGLLREGRHEKSSYGSRGLRLCDEHRHHVFPELPPTIDPDDSEEVTLDEVFKFGFKS